MPKACLGLRENHFEPDSVFFNEYIKMCRVYQPSPRQTCDLLQHLKSFPASRPVVCHAEKQTLMAVLSAAQIASRRGILVNIVDQCFSCRDRLR